MEYIRIPKSDLQTSRIGFGCCPMGGHGWGETKKRELTQAVHAALDLGLSLFDTADVYGLGESEITLGRALARRRPQAVVATKFGVRRTSTGSTYYDNSPAWILEALNGSLKRLKTDYVDLYQMHYWDERTPFSLIFETLERLRESGKIRYFGISNIGLGQIDHGQLPEGLVSFSFEYSLAKRENEKLIRQFAAEQSLGFLSWGSLGQGVLSGKYAKSTKFSIDDRRGREEYVNFHGKRLERNLKIVEGMKGTLEHYPGRTLPQLAARWILDYLDSSVVLVGVKRASQIVDNCDATGWRLSTNDLKLLDALSTVEG